MRKTKVNKRKIKYSKKTSKAGRTYGKNKNLCEKGVTDEVLRFRGLIKELKIKNKKTLKNKPLPKVSDKDLPKASDKDLPKASDKALPKASDKPLPKDSTTSRTKST